MSNAQVQNENICLNITQHNFENQENGFCNVLNTHCMFTEPNLLQKHLDPNLDYIKSQRSDFWTDFDKYETSILADCPQKLNIKILEANSPSFHMTKSFHTADTADTFFNPNHSVSVLDIPSERAQTKDWTTYVRNLKSKDSLDNEHNLKRFSFGNNKSSSVKPKSRAASRYQDPPSELKTRELMWSFDLGGQSSSKDIIVSELDVFSSGKIPTSFQSQTIVALELPKTEGFLAAEAERDSPKLFSQLNRAQTKPKKNEYSRQMVNDIKKKIKIEETKELESRNKIKQLETEIGKMNKKAEANEKKYHTMKMQNENLRKEMIDLLQLNDEYKEESSLAKETIRQEMCLVEAKKEEINNLKSLILTETKSKDQVKESVEKVRKNLTKLSYTIELLLAEKMKYQSIIEEKQQNSNKK